MLGVRFGWLAAFFALGALCGGCAVYQGPVSDHFDGSRFFNLEKQNTFRDHLKWLWEMKTVDWPEWIEDPPQPPPAARVGSGGLRVTYVNQATVLIQMAGLNILTDPLWSKRAGPASWLGAKRVRAPGLAFEKLPPVDYVLISHDHYDHLDLATVERLERRDHPIFIVGLGVGHYLRSLDIKNLVELDWWQLHQASGSGVRITFVPTLHDSGRAMPFSKNRTLWGGFVIDAPEGQVYFAGDTGLGAWADEVATRFRRIRLAILPIGSYEKRWFMKTQHMNPEDAVMVHRLLRARQSMGMHFATLAEHPEQAIDAHEKDLAAALAKQGLDPAGFWLLKFGESREAPALAVDDQGDEKKAKKIGTDVP